MALILFIAATLRLWGLGEENLWLDEALSWGQATMPYSGTMDSVAKDVHPPLYFNVLYATVNTLGDSEAALRLPSAVFGILAVWMVYLVSVRLGFGRYALIAGLLAAVSLFQIRYAQEVRMYSLTAFMSGFSMYTFLGLYLKGSGTKERAWYVLATALLMYSHVYGLFVVIAQNVYAMGVLGWQYLRPERGDSPVSLKLWVVLQGILAAIFLPWFGVLLGQVERVQGGFWITKPGLQDLLKTFDLYSGGIAALSVSLLILGLAVWLRSRGQPARIDQQSSAKVASVYPAAFLLLWLSLPIAIPFVASLVSQPIYYSRYTIGGSQAWYVLIAWSIAVMQGSLMWRWSSRLLLLVVLLGQVPGLHQYYVNQNKTPWQSVTSFVESNAEAGDIVLVHNYNVIEPYRYYVTRDDLKTQSLVGERAFFAQDPRSHKSSIEESRSYVNDVVDGHEQVWIVLAYTRGTEFDADNLQQMLSGDYELSATHQFGRRVAVQRYQRIEK